MHCAADVGFAAAVHFDAVHVPKVHKLDTNALYTQRTQTHYTHAHTHSETCLLTLAHTHTLSHEASGHMQRPTLHVRG